MKNILILLLSIFCLSLSAQEISGQAYYQSKTNSGTDYSAHRADKELQATRKKKDKKLYEKMYILTFDLMESIYEEQQILDEDPKLAAYMRGYLDFSASYTTDIIYKNIQNQKIIEEREFLGKKFLIQDTLPKLNWQLEKESKKIGDYVVFKATATKKIDWNDYRATASKKRDTTENKQSANFVVTAWYTPEIPVPHGPDEYSGLPGLILELNVGPTTFLCTKIILNPGKTMNIKAPKHGTVVTFKEFDQIVTTKKKELSEQNHY